jgi:hypothetical protein
MEDVLHVTLHKCKERTRHEAETADVDSPNCHLKTLILTALKPAHGASDGLVLAGLL